MIEIQYKDENMQKLDEALLLSAARAALEEQSAPQEAGLSVLITDDAQIQTLNREYRGFDKPTDVLSFEANERDPETGFLYLGDIAISLPRATEQAQKGECPLEAEVQLLIVHGILHLLGHDHAEAEEKAKMWAEQAKILARLGLSEINIQEL
ncbi:MAG: rRNA maturation RNase YbeY [Anaerolineae bacterium]|jgi:probable rRNA maturation factor|nr:rRNA maturation RNase YbeY [Anaerolineae bacterium]MBT7069731.1 rRNA maturation RNase YbeY [Anaerolineae bacterium]MBT7326745.1 rRNA maturation RNase YbeY [Anaerolineae bacterium]